MNREKENNGEISSDIMSRRKKGPVAAAIICAFLVISLAVASVYGAKPVSEPAYEGSSAGLKSTIVVPTLDSAMAGGKNVIWCSSFQIAWNRLKKDVIKAPIQVRNAREIVDILNNATQSESDLPPDSYYAAAGVASENFISKIKTEVSKKFHRSAPELSPSPGLIGYAYMEAGLKFTIPFFENDQAFGFTSSGGAQSRVSSFGIREKDEYAYYRLRHQVKVLYSSGICNPEEFIIDPCADSTPSQIVLACIRPGATLRETILSAEKMIADYGRISAGKFGEIGPNDVLIVPAVNFHVEHHFAELEGTDKLIENNGFEGLFLGQAIQDIKFRLDRGGAELASEAKIEMLPIPTYYEFTRPFLIYMKKRGTGQPFFAMWVDNAELLVK